MGVRAPDGCPNYSGMVRNSVTMFGSANMTSICTGLGVSDEFLLMVHLIVLGSGVPCSSIAKENQP